MPYRTPEFPRGEKIGQFFLVKKDITNFLFEGLHNTKGKFALFPIKNDRDKKSLWHLSACVSPYGFFVENTKAGVSIFIHYLMGRGEEDPKLQYEKAYESGLAFFGKNSNRLMCVCSTSLNEIKELFQEMIILENQAYDKERLASIYRNIVFAIC